MVGGCGRRPTPDEARRFTSLCRPQPKYCRWPLPEHDSVSLGLPRCDTDRGLAGQADRKKDSCSPLSWQLGKYVRERARSGVATYEIGSSLLEHRRYPTIAKGVFEG
jgi:hypothetical protein